jgi:hypothetical protein
MTGEKTEGLVTVRSSNGSALCQLTIAEDGSVTLPTRVEWDIYQVEANEFRRRMDHMDALRSRRLHWSSGGDGPTLDDGTPLTKEILASWGWVEHDGGWSMEL